MAPDAPLLAPIATDDVGLIVGPILEGTTTDDSTPTFSGVLAGNIGDIITIYNGNEVIGSTTVGVGGAWSFTPGALDDGDYSFTTTVTDAAGNESGRSPALDFTIDTVAPDAPLLAPIATDDVGLIVGPILPGATTDDSTPTFSGVLAGNIGDIITIYNGDEVIGSTTVGLGGAWSFTPGALDDGDYSFTTTLTDAAGNESGRSPALDFTIDTVAPDAPLIAPIAIDDVGLIVGPILPGATTDDNTPTFSGVLTGNIGDIITIYNGNEAIGSTTVGAGGIWTFTPGALDDGDYSFTTTITDAAGNESGRSPALDFTIDTVAPDAPLLAPIATDDVGPVVGPILNGATTDDNTPTFSGVLTGNIGDIITIYNGDEVIGSTTVGLGGAWSFTPNGLNNGDYSITTTLTDAAGNESGRSPALNFTVDTDLPDAPPLAPIATDDVGLIVGPILEGTTTDDNTPTFSGILAGNIGDIITIYNGDEVIGSTTVGALGVWTFTPGALDDGDYSFTTTITDTSGNESGRSPALDFTIDTVAPDAPLLAPFATDNAGLIVGPILEGATTDDNTPTFSGILAGNIGDIITIYNGDEVIGSTTVGIGGIWSFTPGALDDGDYSFTATITDAAGNESGRSPALDFTIDTVAPDAPLLAPIATDDVGLIVGPILPGTTTDDSTPTFSGVLADDGDYSFTTTITDAAGRPILPGATTDDSTPTFSGVLADDGDYSFTTTITDAAGRPILPGATTDDSTPTFSGVLADDGDYSFTTTITDAAGNELAGNIGDIITIYNGDEVIGSTTVGALGAWSFTPGALDDGDYSFTTTISDWLYHRRRPGRVELHAGCTGPITVMR